MEDRNYQVVPLGIEAVIRETSYLTKEAYKNLAFAKAIRSLPDYCVLDQASHNKFLVEVKYRKDWALAKDALKNIRNQARLFEDIILVIFLGSPPEADHQRALRPSDFIRCCRMFTDKDDICVEVKKEVYRDSGTRTIFVEKEDLSGLTWWHLTILQHHFTKLNESEAKEEQTLIKAIEAISGILGDKKEDI